jgi:hypothetical protein
VEYLFTFHLYQPLEKIASTLLTYVPQSSVTIILVLLCFVSLEAFYLPVVGASVMEPVCTNIASRVTLNDGNSMPWFGLGVYQASAGGETERAVYTALKEGMLTSYNTMDFAS